MAENLRTYDREVVCREFDTPELAIQVSVDLSGDRVRVVEVDGTPACICGCWVPDDILGYGAVWCLSTAVLEEIPRWVARNSRQILSEIADGCQLTGNVVEYDEPKHHIRWLRWLGYTIAEHPVNGKLEFAKWHQQQ